MPNKDQIDIRELRPGVWRIEADYEESFVEWLKQRVPKEDRDYDPDTHFWTITGDKYIPAIEGIGAQKFSYATKVFWRDDKQVYKNLHSGREEIQENLAF
jgi:hypothetical protein